MKKCLLSILLCLCLILSGMTVLGAGAAGGGGSAGAAKPFIPEYDCYENGESYYGELYDSNSAKIQSKAIQLDKDWERDFYCQLPIVV